MSDNLDPVQEEALKLLPVRSPYEGRRLTFGQQVAISAYWFATNFIWGALLVIMLPAEVATIAPEYRGPALGVLIGLGAVVAILVPLIVGALSDRCASKWGRRRPYIASGVAINLVGLGLMCGALTTVPTTVGGRVANLQQAQMAIIVHGQHRGDLGIDKGAPITLSAGPQTRFTEADQTLTVSDFFSRVAPEDRVQATGAWDPTTKTVRAKELRLVKEGDREGGAGLWSFLLATPSFFLLLGAYMVAQFGNNVASAAYSGLIPDLVPADQRGIASGYMALMSQAGTLFGAVGVGVLLGSSPEAMKYILLGFVLAAVAMITLFGIRENPLDASPPKLQWLPYLKSLWIDPRKYPDFAWVWITRAFVMLGFYAIVPFINYYLRDVIRIPEDEVGKQASMLIAVILITSSVSGIYGGALSDRIGRKRVVYISNATIAIVTIGFIFCTSLWHVLIAGVLFGLGFGAYTSVDWALGTDVLPSKKDAAKEMAVWHIAMTLPQSIAAPIAGVLLGTFGTRIERSPEETIMHYTQSGYAAVFGLCAILFALGAYFLKNVRGVK